MKKMLLTRRLVVLGVLSFFQVSEIRALCSDRESLRAIITETRDLVSMLSNCETDFFITQADVPFVATEPGVYCVSENLSLSGTGAAVITIQADNVVINMGGHTIDCNNGDRDGIAGSGVSNVLLYNGTVQNSASSDGAGIYFTDSKGLEFNHCKVRTSSIGFFLNNTVESIFKECVASENVIIAQPGLDQPGIGFLLQESPHNSLSDCKAQSNEGDGFVYTNAMVSGCKNTISVDCVAQSNGGQGFKVEEANHNVFINCVSHMNTLNGFLIQDASYNDVRGCIASGNTENGFLVTLVSADQVTCNILRACEAIQNSGNGIILSGTSVSSNVIMSCIASCNEGDGMVNDPDEFNYFVNNLTTNNTLSAYANVDQPARASTDTDLNFWMNVQ